MTFQSLRFLRPNQSPQRKVKREGKTKRFQNLNYTIAADLIFMHYIFTPLLLHTVHRFKWKYHVFCDDLLLFIYIYIYIYKVEDKAKPVPQKKGAWFLDRQPIQI